MLGKVVRKVCLPRPPIYAKLSLGFVVTESVESHIHCLCALWLNLAVYYAFRRQIVGLDCYILLMRNLTAVSLWKPVLQTFHVEILNSPFAKSLLSYCLCGFRTYVHNRKSSMLKQAFPSYDNQHTRLG